MVNTNSVLSSILFSQTIDWNIKQFFSSTSINSSFELKRIGKAITRRKDQMVVEDDKRYKRITIKTNCGGVFVRDEVLGKDIKTNDEVKNKLKTITQGQKSDKILGLMAMTFRAFCDLADWDSVGTEETNKIETPHVVLKSDNTEKSQTKTVPTTTDMNLHYNIQIHLPETTNMAVYDAIFQSLKKHLM